MSVVAVTMVKNEADVIETCIRHMAAHVDEVLVADNGSTDGTRDLLDTLPCVVVDDPDPAYWQSRKMTALAHRAGETMGATWIVPFDADEIWLPSGTATIGQRLTDCTGDIAPAWVYDHVVTDADTTDVPQKAMSHRMRNRTPLHKVAASYRPSMVIAMGNHQVTYDDIEDPVAVWHLLEVRHFPIRSVDQYIRKARQGSAALNLTDLPEHVGKHWRDWGRLTDTDLAEVFAAHWVYDASDPHVIYDPARLAGQ